MVLIRNINYLKIFLLSFSICLSLIILPSVVPANEGNGFKLTPVQLPSNTPVQISSDSAIYDENKGFAKFTGDVRVGHGPYKIRGEHLEVIFDITDKGKNEPVELIFTEGVLFTNGFEVGKSGKANYDIVSGFIILNEDVMFKQNSSVFFGQTAEFNLNENFMSFKGRINASISTGD